METSGKESKSTARPGHCTCSGLMNLCRNPWDCCTHCLGEKDEVQSQASSHLSKPLGLVSSTRGVPPGVHLCEQQAAASASTYKLFLFLEHRLFA